MKKTWLIGLIMILFCHVCLFAQEGLFIPLEFSNAVKNETRSYDGRPGKKYWQNHVDYRMEVEVDPQNHLLYGTEQASYINHSPDSLKRVCFRLYQDHYKLGNLRDSPVDSADVHNGMKLSDLKINGDAYPLQGGDLTILRIGTLLSVELKEPLAPADSLLLQITWQTRLPEKTRRKRMGAEGDSTAFVALWYPEFSVYDDIDGWDRYSHTGSQEFYHEFSNYDVKITVPGGYLVWASGLLQNAGQVLPEAILARYTQAFETDEILPIAGKSDYTAEDIPGSEEKNVWHFRAVQVPDFAFAYSNCHLWDATSLVVDKTSGRRVMIEGVYMQGIESQQELTEIARMTIEYLSYELPGVPFPYPQFTVFNSHISGGMEFPMMANDGTTRSRERTVALTSHEITHTYFPFLMGINETKYGWMDEGMAVMLPLDLQLREGEGSDRLAREVRSFELSAGREMDMPLITPSIMMHGSALRMATYTRPAIAYTILQDMLGNEKFKQALQTYISTWRGKHPLPYDFFFIFNDVNGESLNWFWKAWFFERGYPDLAISSVSADGQGTDIIIEKIGLLPVPVHLNIFFADSSEQQIRKTAAEWKDGGHILKIRLQNPAAVQRVILGDNHIPDCDKSNNTYPMEAKAGK